MRIHWYWPYSHAGKSSPYITSVLTADDEVVVQALVSRFGVQLREAADYEVIRDLPEANASERPESSIRLAASRSSIYVRRALARHRLVKAGQFDVSCQHHLNHYVDAAALGPLSKNLPLVSFVHDVLPHEPQLPNQVERFLLARTYDSAGELVVYHAQLRDQLEAEFGVDRTRVHVIRHPLTVQNADPPQDRGTCRFLFFGNFRANKGLSDLMAAADLLPSTTDWHLHLAGRADRATAAHVQEAARTNPRISCEIGFISAERKRQLMLEADVIVLPYRRFASQSGVLADAYAYARGLIVTDVGALGSTVREDGSGVVIPAADAARLAEAMEQLLRDASLRQSIALAACEAARLHSFQAVGNQLRTVLERATIGIQ